MTMLKTALALLVLLPCAAQTPEDATPSKKAAAPRPKRQIRQHVKERAKGPRPLDLNTATKDQLLKLPGVTPATADKILTKRPFHSKAALVDSGILSGEAYLKIRDKVMAVQAVQPKQ